MKEKIVREVKKHSVGKYSCGKVYLPKEFIGRTVEITERGKEA